MKKTNFSPLGRVESRFAELVWSNAPLTTAELVSLCGEELNWKRTTTYTVLKKMCERGLFEKRGKTVHLLVSREEFYSNQSREYVDREFGGSLPNFIAAFASSKKLNKEDVDELKRLIDGFSED